MRIFWSSVFDTLWPGTGSCFSLYLADGGVFSEPFMVLSWRWPLLLFWPEAAHAVTRSSPGTPELLFLGGGTAGKNRPLRIEDKPFPSKGLGLLLDPPYCLTFQRPCSVFRAIGAPMHLHYIQSYIVDVATRRQQSVARRGGCGGGGCGGGGRLKNNSACHSCLEKVEVNWST